MRSLLDYDSRIAGPVSLICDLIVLNFFFLLSCLPIFTIGAATSALHYASFKMLRQEGSGVWRTYWKGFRSSFRQATGFWLAALVLAVILAADLWVLPVMLPDFYGIPRLMVTLVLVALCILMVYILALVSRFSTPWKVTLKNAALMMVGHYPQTLLLLLLYGACAAIFLLPQNLFLEVSCVFLILGFSGVNYLATMILNGVFKRYEPV